jgi:AcrR family transcriptional regulator
MQTLKEEIKNKIIEAAIKEFSRHGYEKSSMRTIAKAAGISVSNTYNYYKSKDEMFVTIIEPVFNQLKDVLRQSFQQSMKGGLGNNNLHTFIDGIVKALIQMETRERELLIILIEKSAGTRYEKSRDEIVNLLKMHFAEALRKHGATAQIQEEQSYILTIIANNYIDGLFKILKDYKNREWAEANLRTMLTYHLNGIKSLAA